MNYTGKGYYFQDLLCSLFLLTEYHKMLTNTTFTKSITIDQKRKKNDRFDDIKLHYEEDVYNFQIKYKEKLCLLDVKDLINLSSNLNIWQFMDDDYSEDTQLNLVISLNELNISSDLGKVLIPAKDTLYDLEYQDYMFKDLPSFTSVFFDKKVGTEYVTRFQKNVTKKVTEERLISFISKFRITLVEYSIPMLRKVVLDKIESMNLSILSRNSSEMILNYVQDVAEDGRVNDFYKKNAKELFVKMSNRIQVSSYLTKINNVIDIDKSIFLNREETYCEIEKLITTHNYLNIIGDPGIGKTWLSFGLSNHLKQSNYKVFRYHLFLNKFDEERHVRLDKLRFYTTLSTEISNTYQGRLSRLNLDLDSIKKVVKETSDKVVLIIDGLDHVLREYNENIENTIDVDELLKSFEVISDEYLKVITLSQRLPSNIYCKNKYDVKSLSEDEILCLLSLYEEKLKAELVPLIDKMKNSSNGNPLLLKYIIEEYTNGNKEIFDNNFGSLGEYYDYIYEYNADIAHEVLAVSTFPISELELSNICLVDEKLIRSNVDQIESLLIKNITNNEITFFHESFKRYLIECIKDRYNGEVNHIKLRILDWLKKEKKVTRKLMLFLPSMINELRDYSKIQFEYDLFDFINTSIVENVTEFETGNFLNQMRHYFMLNDDMTSVYKCYHFMDSLLSTNNQLDDETIIYLVKKKYYSGERQTAVNMYSSSIEDRKISRDSAFHLYSFFSNRGIKLSLKRVMFKIDDYSIRENNLTITVNGLFFYSDEGWFPIYKCFLDKLITDLDVQEIISYFGFRTYEDSQKRLKCISELKQFGYYVYIKETSYDETVHNFKYANFNRMFMDYYRLSNENKIKISTNKYKIGISKVIIAEFLLNLISDKKPDFNQLFESLLSSIEMRPLFTSNYGILIKVLFQKELLEEFVILASRYVLIEEHRRNRSGIALIIYILDEIREFIIDNEVELSKEMVVALVQETKMFNSNISNLKTLIINQLLAYLSHVDFDYQEEINNFLISYGSYREMQITELEDIADSLLANNITDKDIFFTLISLSYSAVKNMDKNKDVWHTQYYILEELVKKDWQAGLEVMYWFIQYRQGIHDRYFYRIILCITANAGYNNTFFELIVRYLSLQKNDYSNYSVVNELKHVSEIEKFKKQRRYIVREYYYGFLKRNTKLQDISSEDKKLLISILRKNLILFPSINLTDKSKSIIEDKGNSVTQKNILEFNSFIDFCEKTTNNRHYDEISEESVFELLNQKEQLEKDINQTINNSYKYRNSYEYRKLIDIIHTKYKNHYYQLSNELKVKLLVLTYYRSINWVDGMTYDNYIDLAIKINKEYTQSVLKNLIINTKFSQSMNRKTGKIFKYLLSDDERLHLLNDFIVPNYLRRIPFHEKAEHSAMNNEVFETLLVMVVANCKYNYTSFHDSIHENMTLSKLLDHYSEFYSIDQDLVDKEDVINSQNAYSRTFSDWYDVFLSKFGKPKLNDLFISEKKETLGTTLYVNETKTKKGINVNSNYRLPMLEYRTIKYRKKPKSIYFEFEYTPFTERNTMKRIISYRKLGLFRRIVISIIFLFNKNR